MEIRSRALADRPASLEAEGEEEAAALAAMRRELQVERGRAAPKEDLDRLVAVRDALSSDDPETRYAARVQTHQALRGLIKAMECPPEGEVAVVIGNYAAGMTFSKGGELYGRERAGREGPKEERDWHPDQKA